MRYKYTFFLLLTSTLLNSESFYYQNSNKIYLQPIKIQKSIKNSDIDYFIDQYQRRLGVTDEIIVELDKNSSIDNIVSKYSLTLLRTIGDSFYLLSVKDRSQIFEISAQIYKDDGVKSSNPNFIKQRYMR